MFNGWEVWQGMIGLFIGTLVMVLLPYFRTALEAVAESGDIKSWIKPDWRYLALFLLPVLEFGVGFLTVEGLWQQAQTWKFVNGALLGYSGTHLGKELVTGGSAIYTIAARGFKAASVKIRAMLK